MRILMWLRGDPPDKGKKFSRELKLIESSIRALVWNLIIQE